MAKKAAKKSTRRSSASTSTTTSRRKSASTARTNIARKKTSKKSTKKAGKKPSSSNQIVRVKNAAQDRMKRLQAMSRQVQAASQKMLKQAGVSPAKAREMMEQMKAGAKTVADNTGTFVEGATKAAAMAAGIVVGTLQAVLPDDSAAESGKSSNKR